MQSSKKQPAAVDPGGDNRRQPGDRRALPFGVLYSTSESIIFIEDWLDANCKGRWKVSLEGMDEELVKKSIRMEFEHINDKQAFIERFSPH